MIALPFTGSFSSSLMVSILHLALCPSSPHLTLCVICSVYTVLEPAPGSDGKECLVLTTAQDLSGSAEQMLDRPDFAGLSLSLSVLKQLKDHVGWMSKRLIVLVADEDLEEPREERLHLGVKNFIDDYHLNTLDLLDRWGLGFVSRIRVLSLFFFYELQSMGKLS